MLEQDAERGFGTTCAILIAVPASLWALASLFSLALGSATYFIARKKAATGIATQREEYIVPDEFFFALRSTLRKVAIFFGCSGLYVVAHFTLQTVAFFKVFTNKVGEWTVTQRGANPASRLAPLSEPLLPSSSSSAAP